MTEGAGGERKTLAWVVARALGGALLRVGRAAPDYLGMGGRRDDSDEDTGEWPAPEDARRP